MIVCLSLVLAAVLVVIDQWLKALVIQVVQPVGNIPFIEGLLTWKYSENTGAAFGMLSNQRWVFIVVTGILMAVCLYVMITKYRNNLFAGLVFALILGGGVGNMIDRVWNGYVVDYIFVSFFPAIFNFADCCVVVGAFLAAGALLISDYRAAKAEKAAAKAKEAAEEPESPAE